MFIFERQKERETTRAGEGQRKRETQNQKQDPGSKLLAQSLTQGSNSQAFKLWDHDLSQSQPLNWLSHPGAPEVLF